MRKQKAPMMDTLPPITRWADVQDQIDKDKLTKAEHRLIDAAREGQPLILGETVPTAPDPSVLIRAPLLRYLILGGCDDCRTQAVGVQVSGAWINDILDLAFTKAGPIALYDCHIAEQPRMLQLQSPFLGLNRSALPNGLKAQSAQISGGVVLRGVTSKGEVSLSGATINGQLDCEGATLENAGGDSLYAQGAQIGDGVFLRGSRPKERCAFPAPRSAGSWLAMVQRWKMRAARR
jgi:hypothetical protein